MTSSFDLRETGLVDVERLLRLRERLEGVSEALEAYTDQVAWRRVSLRIEHIVALAPHDLEAAEDALDRLERGMTSQGAFR